MTIPQCTSRSALCADTHPAIHYGRASTYTEQSTIKIPDLSLTIHGIAKEVAKLGLLSFIGETKTVSVSGDATVVEEREGTIHSSKLSLLLPYPHITSSNTNIALRLTLISNVNVGRDEISHLCIFYNLFEILGTLGAIRAPIAWSVLKDIRGREAENAPTNYNAHTPIFEDRNAPDDPAAQSGRNNSQFNKSSISFE